MTEMVVVDGVRVRAGQLDAYLADQEARSSAEVAYVADDGPACPRCGTTFGVIVGGTWGNTERRLIDCSSASGARSCCRAPPKTSSALAGAS